MDASKRPRSHTKVTQRPSESHEDKARNKRVYARFLMRSTPAARGPRLKTPALG